MDRFAIVILDETRFWNEKFRQEHKIASIRMAYILDRERRVHCCELTPSSELTAIGNAIDFDDEATDDEKEQAFEAVMRAETFEIIVMHCRDALKLPAKDIDNIDKLLDEPVSDDDETYWKQTEEIREYYQSNQAWT